jgi:2'-5' RNA ligase
MSACNRKLHEVVRSFEPPDMWHLTVKFLGHSSENLNDEAIIDLLPELYDLTKKYLPLTIYIRGFSTFTYKNNRNSVIFLKVMPNKALIEMHYEICEKFSDRFIFFDHADKDNFEPHITLSKDLYKGKDEKIERLVARSRKMAKRRLKLDDLVVMSPTRLFPVTKEINRPLICPPVK